MFGPVGRRQFLRALGVGGAGLFLDHMFARMACGDVFESPDPPYGELIPQEPVDGGEIYLALPRNFRYRVLTRNSQVMSDGYMRPRNPDGMAAFDVGGFIRVVRNHERPTPGTAFANPLDAFDFKGTGGTTTLVVDPVTRKLVREFASLSGTVDNCNGGKTPWGTWLTCEETVVAEESGFNRRHGYVFEVDPAADRGVTPVPYRAMGRFVHESVAIDRTTSIAYMTEDEGAAGFYRFVPNTPQKYADGGRLQMLGIAGQKGYNASLGQTVGKPLPVIWADIRKPDPSGVAPGVQPVFDEGRSNGGARFRRLEGTAADGSTIYFSETEGGAKRLGCIWRYRPTPPMSRRSRTAVARIAEGELTLMYEASETGLKNPDNLCMTPRGSLMICEDSGAGPQHLRCMTPTGEIFDFARCVLPGFESSELSGVTFSPDGQTLFMNIYGAHATLAIWGDWHLGPM